MKKIILAVLLFFVGVTFAAEAKQLEQLCGFKFGEEIKGEFSKAKDGDLYVSVPPRKQFMEFNSCTVYVTANSHKVFCVLLAKNFGFGEGVAARAYFEKVAAVLNKHYNITPEREIMGDYTYNFPNGRVLLSHSSLGMVTMQAYSFEYREMNKKEKANNAVNETDTSAL